MFLQFYGLREQPFGVTPNFRYVYPSEAHREAMASLLYAVEADVGFSALIANPGMGKTTLLFHLMTLLRESAVFAFVFQTQCNSREFMRALLTDFKLPCNTNDDEMVMHERIQELLTREASHRRVVIIIDEAQNLQPSVLETVRLLSNFETPERKLLHILLAGQPQLAVKLRSESLVQFEQRIQVVARITPFRLDETIGYIEYRLRTAGCSDGQIFSNLAYRLIAEASKGIPRNINRLCFNALSLGCALGKKQIDDTIVKSVIEDLDFGSFQLEEGKSEANVASEQVKEMRSAKESAAKDSKRAEAQQLRTGTYDRVLLKDQRSGNPARLNAAPFKNDPIHSRSASVTGLRNTNQAIASPQTFSRKNVSAAASASTTVQRRPLPKRRHNVLGAVVGVIAGIGIAFVLLSAWTHWNDAQTESHVSATAQQLTEPATLVTPETIAEIADKPKQQNSETNQPAANYPHATKKDSVAKRRNLEEEDRSFDPVLRSLSSRNKNSPRRKAQLNLNRQAKAQTPISSQARLPAGFATPVVAHIVAVTPVQTINAPQQSSRYEPGRPLRQAQPESKESRGSSTQGEIVVTARITEDGSISSVHPASTGNLRPDIAPQVIKATEETLRAWKYAPARIDGRPVGSEAQLRVIFTLSDAAPAPTSSAQR